MIKTIKCECHCKCTRTIQVDADSYSAADDFCLSIICNGCDAEDVEHTKGGCSVKKCPRCKGAGVRHGAWVINWPCSTCKGRGVVPESVIGIVKVNKDVRLCTYQSNQS